jgi:hypothetical protein
MPVFSFHAENRHTVYLPRLPPLQALSYQALAVVELKPEYLLNLFEHTGLFRSAYIYSNYYGKRVTKLGKRGKRTT